MRLELKHYLIIVVFALLAGGAVWAAALLVNDLFEEGNLFFHLLAFGTFLFGAGVLVYGTFQDLIEGNWQ